MNSEIDLAYCAGMFIADGCVTSSWTHNSSGDYEYLQIMIGMNDERSIRKFIEVTKAQYAPCRLKHLNNKLFHRATAKGRTAEIIVAMLWPYMKDSDKADQALVHATRMGSEDWITGVRTDPRPQLNNKKRGVRCV